MLQSKTIAEQKAEKINAKLGYKPPSEENEESEMPAETFKRYEEELDINDFPQTARWKVTSKVSALLDSLEELSHPRKVVFFWAVWKKYHSNKMSFLNTRITNQSYKYS